ncbi:MULTISPECIES: DUF680 domain-containing protein [Phyllobacteriaceae]|jgi:hypothetical protein|uniref:DUF680 domain-containing protein n=1 Tax=Mesorhizobium hungaricum TaxID=1566387 RepID=A0A1C2DV60_9HYPH|nr:MULTISPECIES: DUF680 domain-containing protein [Mesorhizobium]MBN9234182.1 hypothetical protein [Mesorhizobium sp.]MDQ0331718.1 hypothetical protein [Mesorhizobium sp. YL-MeA3-2017]OCX18680.1 hypothetical protein QV13_10520 [Mesorhizobium hungaricum]
MKKIALATAALLVAAGSAFAGSDNFNAYAGSNPHATVDSSYTASVKGGSVSHDASIKDVKPITDGAPRLGGNS